MESGVDITELFKPNNRNAMSISQWLQANVIEPSSSAVGVRLNHEYYHAGPGWSLPLYVG